MFVDENLTFTDDEESDLELNLPAALREAVSTPAAPAPLPVATGLFPIQVPMADGQELQEVCQSTSTRIRSIRSNRASSSTLPLENNSNNEKPTKFTYNTKTSTKTKTRKENLSPQTGRSGQSPSQSKSLSQSQSQSKSPPISSSDRKIKHKKRSGSPTSPALSSSSSSSIYVSKSTAKIPPVPVPAVSTASTFRLRSRSFNKGGSSSILTSGQKKPPRKNSNPSPNPSPRLGPNHNNSTPSPNANAKPSPSHLILSKPLDLTKSASSQSYLLKYSKTTGSNSNNNNHNNNKFGNRKDSAWKRLLISTTHQPSTHGQNHEQNHEHKRRPKSTPSKPLTLKYRTRPRSATFTSTSTSQRNNEKYVPQTISISAMKKYYDNDDDGDNNEDEDLDDSVHTIPLEDNFNDNENYQGDTNDDDDNIDDELNNMTMNNKMLHRMRSSDDMMLQLPLPSLRINHNNTHNNRMDDSIFRCKTPIMRNRLDTSTNGTSNINNSINSSNNSNSSKNEDDKDDIDKIKRPIIIEEDEVSLEQLQQQLELQIKVKYSLDESMLTNNDAEQSGLNSNAQSSIYSVFSYFQGQDGMSIIYLTVFAIIGSTIRVFLGRIFGYDCELASSLSTAARVDYLSPLSTCVTSSGVTDQHGGALFTDLPANMIGSFFLGVMTPLQNNARHGNIKNIPPLPWLKYNHPLQNNGSMHTSIRTGFCGSLTTFSSWNTQMVIMMIGKGTVLGSQIVPALMGYLIGLMLAIVSFLSGRQFAYALYTCRHRRQLNKDGDAGGIGNDDDEIHNHNLKKLSSDDIEANIIEPKEETNENSNDNLNDQNSISYSVSTGVETTSSRPMVIFPRIFSFDGNGRSSRKRTHSNSRSRLSAFSFDHDDEDSVCHWLVKSIDCIMHGKFTPIIFTIGLFTCFLVGDLKSQGGGGTSFNRTMWVTCLVSPLGTIIRWRFSFLNGKWFKNSDFWKYIPIGTLLCNILACIISALCAAFLLRIDNHDENTTTARLILNVVKVGFAGNLSTVSTFVKEVVHLNEKTQLIGTSLSHLYAIGTLCICCCVSLCVYGPIVQ